MNVISEIIFPRNSKDVSIHIPKVYKYIVFPCILIGSFNLLSVSLRSINKLLLQKEEIDIRIFPFFIINGVVVYNSFGVILSIIINIKNN